MDLLDMMRDGVTKKIRFAVPFWNSCAVYFLRGSRAILPSDSAARALACGVNRSWDGILYDRQLQ
jgi:hypothetical protein